MEAAAAPVAPCEWRVVAASVAGGSHEKSGLPCQDAHQWRRLPNGLLAAAVADGAGSAALAEIGSAAAAAAAVEWIGRRAGDSTPPDGDDRGWQALLADALRAALAALEKEAADRRAAPRDLATTLILVIASRSLVAAAQIGDGAALVRNEAGDLIALTRPDGGEHVNETTFLVSPNAIASAQMRVWRGRAGGIAAFSDGLQMLALRMSDHTPHAPFFTPLFSFAAGVADQAGGESQLRAFLRSSRIAQRTDDDLTLLLATLRG